MSVLSHQSIRRRNIFTPFVDRTMHDPTQTTYGCGAASYDVRLAEDVILYSNVLTLASTVEHFTMPNDVCGIVHDKSSLARIGVLVQNTFIDPGWNGYLTLELTYHSMQPPDHPYSPKPVTLELKLGTPIAQIVLHQLDQVTQKPYEGRYQDQERGPQGSVSNIDKG